MIVRKVSVGQDYKSDAMHYVLGQDVLRGEYKISLMLLKDNGTVDIWIKNTSGTMLWKTFNSNMPISIEYDIDF